LNEGVGGALAADLELEVSIHKAGPALRVIFTYYYTPPKPYFSTRVPIACQLYEHAKKLSQG